MATGSTRQRWEPPYELDMPMGIATIWAINAIRPLWRLGPRELAEACSSLPLIIGFPLSRLEPRDLAEGLFVTCTSHLRPYWCDHETFERANARISRAEYQKRAARREARQNEALRSRLVWGPFVRPSNRTEKMLLGIASARPEELRRAPIMFQEFLLAFAFSGQPGADAIALGLRLDRLRQAIDDRRNVHGDDQEEA